MYHILKISVCVMEAPQPMWNSQWSAAPSAMDMTPSFFQNVSRRTKRTIDPSDLHRFPEQQPSRPSMREFDQLLTCDHCLVNLSMLEDKDIITCCKDLGFEGYLKQTYEEYRFCSPGCVIAMFMKMEEEYMAKELAIIAIKQLSGRYPCHAFNSLPYGCRFGEILSPVSIDDSQSRHEVSTKHRRRNNPFEQQQ